MSLAEFAANYTTRSGQEPTEHESTDAAEDEQSESIKLKSGLGRMYKRRKEATIRFHQQKEPSKVYRSKIMLYIPWRDESSDLLGGYMNFCSHYELMAIWTMNGSILKIPQRLKKLLMIYGPPEHAWDQIVPGAAEQRAQAEAFFFLTKKASCASATSLCNLEAKNQRSLRG